MNNKKQKKQLGATLVEVLVGIGLIVLLSASLYFALFNAVRVSAETKQKVGAIALANEKMEVIRNLSYENIGTVGWIPVGPIPQEEEVEKNGFSYTVKTSINYIDDPFDGEGDADSLENDYKLVRVVVYWISGDSPQELEFASIFVPGGLESDIGGGVLSVNIVDLDGDPIPGAIVSVESVHDNPQINGSVTTDTTGNIRLPGMPEQEYQIAVSKSGYETVQTYPAPPDSPFTPIDQNLIIVEGSVIMKTFIMDQVGSLTLLAKNVADDEGILGVDVYLKGGRIIGSNPETVVVDGSTVETTDSEGEIIYESLGSSEYEIVNFDDLAIGQYSFVGTNTDHPFQLEPGESLEADLMFADSSVNALFVNVFDSVTFEPIDSAEVHVTGTSFDQTANTDQSGSAYFPTTEGPMSSGNYQIEVQATGYQMDSSNSIINGFTEKDVQLVANP